MAKKKSSSKKRAIEPHIHHNHPNHTRHLKQLARVRGQVDGIEKMITEGRYCIDIINQLKSISAGVKIIESAIFEAHLKSCVQEAFASNNPDEIEDKINEINKLVYGPKSKG
ncbi:hypothetical protein C0V70_05870 [Bacteriovorax stolpii]|uniref:Uncharacterized protein n=1 Tax=Bacteriovorax stolpii TaxID=960 RepID=A0A2K9NQ67_BACTC|nr:metal-sensitive transcriptional regulator [Bacteriovorax stolpii]AUN97649.1 hypothetical protein C0V70_05870 [Bacteriovorax stolpii]TDP52830.1 DNA-binding FrmR family transcriptional regulator [Bacteriovorax stolpii]